MDTLSNVNTRRGGTEPSHVGFTSSVSPEVQGTQTENSHTGVSTRNAPLPSEIQEVRRAARTPHWYALRVTYGREKQAYDYIISQHGTAYYPTIKTLKVIDGKKKKVEESRLPNILFAYGTEDAIKAFVYDNVNLPYLRFYYHHFHEGVRIIKEPLVVPDYQIESLKIICASEADDIIFVPSDIHNFKIGQSVRVIDGVFKGVIGKVARYHGQQRVAIVIDGLATIASAYVPSAFLEQIQ